MLTVVNPDKYQVFPPLTDDQLDGLRRSVAERGVLAPVIVDERGDIIEGHNRVMLADSLGLDYPTHVLPGLDEAEKRIVAVELNLTGRKATDAQRTYAGMEIEHDVETVALARRDAGRHLPDNCPEGGETRNIVASKVGLGCGRTYERNKDAIAWAETHRPDLIPDLKAGTATLKEVRRARFDWLKGQRVAESEPDAGDDSDGDEPAPADGFRVILADPPWQYTQRSQRLNGTTDRHYGTMTADDIKGLPVAEIAAADAVLLLWTTWPFLPVALDIIAAWGFAYVTGLPWVKVDEIGTDFGGDVRFKPQYGVGHWIRGASEPLLLAKRGAIPAVATNFVGLLSDNALHSRKPGCVHALGEALGAPRIELFGRQRRAGWTVVGNAVDDGQDIKERLHGFIRPA